MATSIYDMVLRQQLYLEAVKNWQARDFSRALSRMQRELKIVLAGVEKPSLDTLTKKQMNELLTAVKAMQTTIIKDYYDKLNFNYRAFAEVERALTVEIFEDYLGTTIEKEEDNDFVPLFAFAILNGKDKTNKLFGSAAIDPVPATGQTMDEMIKGYFSQVIANTRNALLKVRANKGTIADGLTAIVGTKDRAYRDGLFNRFYTQFSAIVATTYQHLASFVRQAVHSVFFAQYIWISVIDSVTTQICTDRDQNLYRIGFGPLPPAHYRCRSHTLPVERGAVNARRDPGNLTAWLRAQPEAVQNDILGPAFAIRLRAGRLNIDEPKVTDRMPPLSIADYAKKRGLIAA